MVVLATWTPILAEAAHLLSDTVLVDTIDVYTVGDVETVGYVASRPLTLYASEVPALVQTTILANAVESAVESTYSVKVARGQSLHPGMAVRVTQCGLEPDLVGKTLLIDKVSENGAAVIRKAVASDVQVVNQEGKESLSV